MAKKPMQRPFRFVCQLPEVIADTSHLSAEAFGALMRLRMAYWRNGPVKDDNQVLARIVGMQPKEWARTRPELVPFFEITSTWTCWVTHRDLEASYEAIAANKGRTEAARLAKLKRKLKLNADKAFDNLCDRACDNDCDKPSDSVSNNACNNSFDNVLIGSIRSDHGQRSEITIFNPSLAKAKNVISEDGLDALVAAVEAEFEEAGHGL